MSGVFMFIMKLIWIAGAASSIALMCRADADGRKLDMAVNLVVATGLFALAITAK